MSHERSSSQLEQNQAGRTGKTFTLRSTPMQGVSPTTSSDVYVQLRLAVS